jgi:uncharacterized protein (TIGR04255 family)
MAFPQAERVVYRHNPLEQVICQLKFPTVLRIESELPAKFQDKIRQRYPIFSEPQALAGAPEVPEQLLKLVGSLIPLRPGRVYEFASEDGRYRLTLSKEFIALGCSDYEQWEQFIDHFKAPLEALSSEYSPAFFSRIGLRYRNVIRRTRLKLEGVAWNELLKPHIAAELASPIGEDVEEASHQIVVRFEGDNGKVKIQHGLVKAVDTGEVCYVIDNDFFTEQRTEVKNAVGTLDYFHGQSGKLFQWCIQPKLHAAMQPQVVGKS